jgi:GNAT superfamily N-acetyltransferase
MVNYRIRLRQYKPDDLEQTVHIWHASKRVAFPYVEIQQRYTLAEDMAYFRDVVVRECIVWLAEVDGRIAGLLAIRGDYIDQLFVAVEQQRQGIGSVLLQKAREHSPYSLRLHTFQKNARARAFYEKHSFQAIRFGRSPAPENEPDVEYQWWPERPMPLHSVPVSSDQALQEGCHKADIR